MTETVLAPPGTGLGPARRWAAPLRLVGELLITAGVVIMLFLGYELWFTGLYTKEQQHTLTQQLERSWDRQSPPTTIQSIPYPPVGAGFAVMRVPRLGRSWKFVVIEGTGAAELKKGPGHFPGTALPGDVGNFSVAGHRTTYLAPFYNLDRLRTGDRIYVETRTAWFIYRVQDIPGTPARARQIVEPTAVDVAYPVPHQPDAERKPTLRVLTLTTCNPRYSATQRLIVHALLVTAQPKSLGPPPDLAT